MTFARQFLSRQFVPVFGLWTLVALCSGLADLAWLRLTGVQTPAVEVFRRPLIEQWIWAALTPLVFELARRFPLAMPNLARALGIHGLLFVALSALHCTLAEALGSPLAAPVPRGYGGSPLVMRFLEEFYSDIWMYWPLVGIRALIDARALERERDQRESRLKQLAADLQLSLLRAQIQPHFLFNTLHAVIALMRVDARRAEDMLADLAQILRASFANQVEQEMPLRSELALVGCYLRIQQQRLGDRLALRQEIAPETLDALVPALVLQSLVENAVVHGIAPLNRPGRLHIRACLDGRDVVLSVRDDGAGIALPAAAPGRARVGLANTRERLRQLYGKSQSMDLESVPGAGTCVTLRFPFHHGDRLAARA